jgi:hypothetical protein
MSALLEFDGEAALYSERVSDVVARDHAFEYARVFGVVHKESSLPPRTPIVLFETNRSLIRSAVAEDNPT